MQSASRIRREPPTRTMQAAAFYCREHADCIRMRSDSKFLRSRFKIFQASANGSIIGAINLVAIKKIAQIHDHLGEYRLGTHTGRTIYKIFSIILYLAVAKKKLCKMITKDSGNMRCDVLNFLGRHDLL